MDELAKHIERCLKEREFCVVCIPNANAPQNYVLKADAHFQALKRRLLALRIASAHTGIPMQFRFKIRRASPHGIQVFVDRIEQLFNSMDPSPFPDKDLDEDAEEFIVSWVEEFPTNDPISLVIQVNQLPARSDVQESVQTAIRNYFAYRMKLKGFELRRLLKQGRTSLFIGLAFLSACLLISHMLVRQWPGTWSDLVQESLTIGGWVAMWRPMEIFLYEWWPIRRTGRLYQKMSRMHVEVKKRAV